MKALTLLQPFASLIGWTEKVWETRSFKTNFRGEMAITASKTWNADYRRMSFDDPFRAAIKRNSELGYQFEDKLDTMPCGCVVAVGDLTEIITTEKWMELYGDKPEWANEKAFGNYMPLRYAWHFENVVRLPVPVPCRGLQMVWNLPGSIEAEVRKQMAGAIPNNKATK